MVAALRMTGADEAGCRLRTSFQMSDTCSASLSSVLVREKVFAKWAPKQLCHWRRVTVGCSCVSQHALAPQCKCAARCAHRVLMPTLVPSLTHRVKSFRDALSWPWVMLSASALKDTSLPLLPHLRALHLPSNPLRQPSVLYHMTLTALHAWF